MPFKFPILRTTAELLQLYALEGFLARLAASVLRDRFVLKGGMLLAAFDARRPTRDVDLLALRVSAWPCRLAVQISYPHCRVASRFQVSSLPAPLEWSFVGLSETPPR